MLNSNTGMYKVGVLFKLFTLSGLTLNLWTHHVISRITMRGHVFCRFLVTYDTIENVAICVSFTTGQRYEARKYLKHRAAERITCTKISLHINKITWRIIPLTLIDIYSHIMGPSHYSISIQLPLRLLRMRRLCNNVMYNFNSSCKAWSGWINPAQPWCCWKGSQI